MDKTGGKVNDFFKELGFDFPENPEVALETSINAIRENPAVRCKLLNIIEELRKKLNESGGNWENIKNWIRSVLVSKNPQINEVEAAPESESVKAKYAPLIPEADVLSKVLFGLLSNIQRDKNILKEYEELLGSKLKLKVAVFLDAIADHLESKGLIKKAYNIDKISDEIESMSI